MEEIVTELPVVDEGVETCLLRCSDKKHPDARRQCDHRFRRCGWNSAEFDRRTREDRLETLKYGLKGFVTRRKPTC